MKNLFIVTVGIFLLVSFIAPVRLKTMTLQQCGYNGPGNTDETCIADCTLCNTTTETKTLLYPLIVSYIVDIKDRNNDQTESIYESDIVRNEIIIAILVVGFVLAIKRRK